MDKITEDNPVEETTNDINLRDIFVACINHWRWYVVTVAVALVIAFYYIKKTEPTYKCDASIMILDRNQESSALSNLLADFTDMGFSVADKTNVNNVTAAIQSPDVMSEVVSKLGIDVSYTSPATFYNPTLYGKTLPVKVLFLDVPSDESASLHLQLNDDGTVELSDFNRSGKTDNSETLKCRVGQTVHTPVGILSIIPTKYYASAIKNNKDIYVKKSDNGSATQRFLGGLSVSIEDKKSTILNLSYTDVSTTRAEDILGAVINIYNDVWKKNRNALSVNTSKFIDERLSIIERELDTVDTDISSYKSKNLMPDIEKSYNLSMDRADKNSAELLDLNTRLSVARYIRDYLIDKSNTNQLIPVDLGIDNDNIEKQISDYNTIQLERNTMVANSGRQNPLVKDMDKSLSQIRRSVIYSIDNLIVSLSTGISHLQNDEVKTNTNISANPAQAKFLLSVERQQKVKEALYLFLLQKREENKLSQSFTADNSQIIKSPVAGNSPIAPKTQIILLVGLLIGLAIPTGIIYLLEITNATVRGRKDLEGRVTVPLLGEIPQIGKSKSKWQSIKLLSCIKLPSAIRPAAAPIYKVVVEPGNHDIVNEAFRMLRTNIEFMFNTDSHTDVAMLTSFNTGSGKTFMAMNIAASLAIKEKRVLVIDGDLRKASLSGFIGKPSRGLSNYLGRQTDNIELLIRRYDKCAGLDILPVGTIPPNPAELLASDRLTSLLSEMRSRYDYIFIDCPPMDVVADTAIISKKVDRSIFVVRAGLLDRAMLDDLEKIYKTNRLTNLTMVLNGIECAAGSYSYRYGYNYGYGV